MGVLRKILRRLRQKIYFSLENLVRSLHRFHDVMAQTPLAGKYWVCGGMLLGYTREGQLIKNDYDFDFHYWRDDDTFEQAPKKAAKPLCIADLGDTVQASTTLELKMEL